MHNPQDDAQIRPSLFATAHATALALLCVQRCMVCVYTTLRIHYLLRTLKSYTVMHIDVLHMLLSACC
eukprot:20721-Heterococcus_DN1.PRE.3